MPELHLCDACDIECTGCPCDGSLDDGCFLCTPEKHQRPPCPPTCPNYGSISAGKIEQVAKAVREGKVAVSGNAVASVAAALAGPRERTDEEKAFDEMVAAVVIKDGHRQAPPTREVHEHDGVRLYTVTTIAPIAPSARYGGTRTPVVCSTFESAKSIVEKNKGDIFETTYRLAVIEAVVADWLYGGTLDEQYWYVWKGDYESGGYVPIERPKQFEGTIGIGGIG